MPPYSTGSVAVARPAKTNTTINSIARKRSSHETVKKPKTTRPQSKTVEEGADHDHNLVSNSRSLKGLLNDLLTKSASTKEKALETILESFSTSDGKGRLLSEDFLQNNSITLFSRCMACIKSSIQSKSGSGSIKVAILACQTIGLLTLAVDHEGAKEIFEFGISDLFQALKLDIDHFVKSSILDVLAIITVVGARNIVEDAETSMQAIWEYLHAGKPNTQAMVSAISAWSFILANLHRWEISCKSWKGSISFFCNLLQASDASLRIVAGETLAHILEIDAIEKFSHEEDLDCKEDLTCKKKESKRMQKTERIKENILDQVKKAIAETSDQNNLTKTLQCSSFNIVKFLKSGRSPDISVMIDKDHLLLSSWPKLIQVDFMIQFLGSSSGEHGKLFKSLFHFNLKKRSLQAGKLDTPLEEEKSISYVYQPELIKGKGRVVKRMMSGSPNSPLNRSMTELRNKERASSQAKKSGHYSVTAEDE